MNICTPCNGIGSIEEPDDNYGYIRDVCYHCSGSGQVDNETELNDQLNLLVQIMTDIKFESWLDSIQNFNDGEDIEFMAAENMCSVDEIKESRRYDIAYSIGDELSKLLPDTLELLLELVFKKSSDIEDIISSEEYSITKENLINNGRSTF
jgi:hypothetical protein